MRCSLEADTSADRHMRFHIYGASALDSALSAVLFSFTKHNSAQKSITLRQDKERNNGL